MLPRIWISVLATSALAIAQNSGQSGSGSSNSQNNSGSSGTNSGSTNSSGSSSGSNSGQGQPRGLHAGSAGGSGREAISGRVILSDGADPGPDITIERVCGTSLRGETHPDSGGRFTLPPGSRDMYSSETDTPDAASGCELRTSLNGYITTTVALGTGHSMGGGDVMILLRPLHSTHDMTVSATTLLAPKQARKAYEKGLAEAGHNSPDQAQKHFAEAVGIDPRYAAAWLELGKIYEQRDHREEARDAYNHAIAADGAYLVPYVRLVRLDASEQRWKEAADASAKVLRLDPYEFSEAFYLNAVANLELNQLDAAERSAREAVKLEGAQAEPRGNYVLGLILLRKGDLAGAEDKLQDFLAQPYLTGLPEQSSARKMLAEIEQQRRRRMAREAEGH